MSSYNDISVDDFWPNSVLVLSFWEYYKYSPQLTAAQYPDSATALEQARVFAWDLSEERGLVAKFKLILKDVWETGQTKHEDLREQGSMSQSAVSWKDVLLGGSVADGLAAEDLDQLLKPILNVPRLSRILKEQCPTD